MNDPKNPLPFPGFQQPLITRPGAELIAMSEEDYVALIQTAVHNGITDATRIPGGSACVLRGELVAVALVDALAVFMSSSPKCKTMRGTRDVVDSFAARLKKTITNIVVMRQAQGQNVTVLNVDLSRPQDEGDDPPPAPSAA